MQTKSRAEVRRLRLSLLKGEKKKRATLKKLGITYDFPGYVSTKPCMVDFIGSLSDLDVIIQTADATEDEKKQLKME